MVAVAVDVAPLHGPRTGVGVAVAGLLDALARVDPALVVVPYLTSLRARPEAGTRRLPYPAALAVRCWARLPWPPADRFLRPARVVHGTNYVVPPGRLPRLVSVYDCWFLRHEHLAVPDVRRAGAVLRRAVARGATVHTTSQATAGQLAELFPTCRIEVVPLGPPPALPEPPEQPPIPHLSTRPFVVAIGTLERRKNLPCLVRAFGELASDHPELHLVLAGADGDDRGAVDDACRALPSPVARRVVLPGRVDDATKSWLLHRAEVLAYPSLDEGFGFPLLEAMAADTPIVASTAGSIPEVAGDAALYAPPDDVGALTHALAQALSDQQLRGALLSAGRRRLGAFDWAATAKSMAALYSSLSVEHDP
jgi:glycosyltransferase involved in cell wall biosynthesis